ncbi:MAG: DHHW family protein [Oscillospiraceae bacterium]
MKKRIYAPAVIFVIILVFSAVLCYNAGKNSEQFPKATKENILSGEFFDLLEEYVEECVPKKQEIRQLATGAEKLLGRYEFGDIYVGENMLLEKAKEPNENMARNNIEAISEFTQQNRIPVYSVIVPTKVAIMQQQLPIYTELTDQKNFIERVYNKFSGVVSCVDIYPTLFAHQNEYIYYKTDERLTSLGNYYGYKVLINRLGKIPRPIDDFKMWFVCHEYYGETYKKSGYTKIEPDIITVFKYKNKNLSFRVVHNDTNEQFDNVYSQEAIDTEQWDNVFLGGYSNDITITTQKNINRGVSSDKYNLTLLVFGDESAVGFLPFLALHYDEIRFVNIENMTAEEIFQIDANYYGQIAFIYSFDTFSNTEIPSKIKNI